jgi:enoyl-[acyl-carrier protein] reductase II
MAAAFALGADGVQVGSRFVASVEASAHQAFKDTVIQTTEGGTQLTLKELTPVRLIKNSFYDTVAQAYASGADSEQLKTILGRGRAKKGMFEGDLVEGELEIGQGASMLREILPAATIVEQMMHDCTQTFSKMQQLR